MAVPGGGEVEEQVVGLMNGSTAFWFCLGTKGAI